MDKVIKVSKKISRGRPSDFKSAYCQLLITHMKEGLSFESFGGVIGKCEKTLFNWLDKYPEFLQSKKEGEAYSRLFWERLGIDGISGKIPGFNATTWIFNMKNRFSWRDRHDIDHSASGGQVQVKVLLNSPNPFNKQARLPHLGESQDIAAEATPIDEEEPPRGSL